MSDIAVPLKRRGRPPKARPEMNIEVAPITERETMEQPTIESLEQSIESLRPAMRPAMRPDPRSVDTVADANRRAAEILEHLGGRIEASIDRFAAPKPPDGWTYEWKTESVYGKEDPHKMSELARMGWEPVPTDRHPEMMPKGDSGAIRRDGMVLMMRPAMITEKVRHAERIKAGERIRAKQEQLSGAPQGHFERSNNGSPLAKIKTTYESIPIPKE